MAIIDRIYENVDDFGLITPTEARALGLSGGELVQQARRGKLVRVGRGVYRMPIWPYQDAAPYAIAVKAAGEGAYLYGESVVALLGLAPTDPRRIWVASPNRIRRSLGEGVMIVWRRQPEPTTRYEGIPCQRAANAITSALPAIGMQRALQAAEAAHAGGYVSAVELESIEKELG